MFLLNNFQILTVHPTKLYANTHAKTYTINQLMPLFLYIEPINKSIFIDYLRIITLIL